MRQMKKWMLAAILICGTATVFTSCSSNDDNPVGPETPKATDYSQKASWLQLPEITKERRGERPESRGAAGWHQHQPAELETRRDLCTREPEPGFAQVKRGKRRV